MRGTIAHKDMKPMGEDNEAVYDSKISPLMTQIIAICKEHCIPMVASFEFAPGDLCTTRLPFLGERPELESVRSLLQEGFFAFTTKRTTP